MGYSIEIMTKQGVASNNQTYATLDFSDSKTTQKMNRSVVNTMYAETQAKQGASANKLTYAALEFSASKKTGKPKYNDKNTEYTKIPEWIGHRCWKGRERTQQEARASGVEAVGTGVESKQIGEVVRDIADGTSIQVTQHPEHIVINTGENVKFSCNFPDTKIIKTNWWKQGESEYLKIDHKKQFDQKSARKTSLELLDVRHQDSGIYYCAAMTAGYTTVNGSGSHLTVYEITTGIHTTERQNTEGLFEASSSVEETQSVQNGTVYICRVSHISLQTPGIRNYTIYKVYLPDKEKDRHLYPLLIAGCAVGVAVLVLLVYFGNRSKLMKMKGVHRKQNDLDHQSQQEVHGGDAERVTYITLDLKSSDKLSRPKHKEDRTVYAKIKQKAENNKQVYASLEFSGPEKGGKPKRSKPNTVYATVQGKQGVAANKLTYAALEFSGSKKAGKPKHSDKNTEYAKIQV
eukprot:gi/632975133/ref/XP_007904055.1/ PREDICTED: uncharacterized protein LOC103186685 [Callorhinchus milii]